MSDIKNFLKEKKQQNTSSSSNTQHFDDITSKKKKDVQIKEDKNDDWNDDVFPDYNVNVKNYTEMKSKKQEKPSKVSGVSDWEKEITKLPHEEEEENKVQEPVMKQVKAPEKKAKACFADKIKLKTEKKKTQMDIEEEFFPELGVEVVKLPEPPKPKNESKPAVEEKKDMGPRKFVNNKKPENTLQKPLETIALTTPEEKKPEPKSEIKGAEGPRKFISKKKDEKEQNQEKSQADLKKEETERRIEEKLKEDEEKKKRITKAPFGDQKLEKEKEQTQIVETQKMEEKTGEDKEKKMMKFVNKKVSNINNNVPLVRNGNSDNKEDVTNQTQTVNGQKADEDFKVVVAEKKKHEHANAEKGKEKDGKFKIVNGKKEKEKKANKDIKPEEKNETKTTEREPILEKKEEIPKIVHFTAVASTWD